MVESTKKIEAKMDIILEKLEAATHSIGSELEETIKDRVADILSCVVQKAQGLRKELTEKNDETQVDLQAIRTSVDSPTKGLLQTITDTREHLHAEHGLMIQSETQMTKTLTDTMRRGLEAANIAEVEARAQSERTGTGAGTAKLPKFDGTTSWAVFRRQIENAEEDNCWTHSGKSTYLITALQGRATDVLHGVPKCAIYEETLEALEDRFGDQHLAADYGS
jgi:hypothetical protein